ncbi:MAG: DUF4258 domain-containing protein [Dehalococcoidia bacterium]|nr:MAG: DUF4258 domain-containing protein [Dehalococcoidia bacterium]
MDIANIINAIQANRVNITQHARKEAKDDNLLLDEILYSTRNGEIIEDYPDDTPYPSCLVYGQNQDTYPVHSVWAYATDSQIAILITVYRPDPNRWVDWKIRK